ncbi:MAG: DUF1674 domain-containing protein [Thermomonas sp.]|nr:DUF1674 domain-containing protein [Xanthomonadales bacterium]MBN8795890.1 DUF1674 domain-containing protein [Stenotrophomonas nitritireducens]
MIGQSPVMPEPAPVAPDPAPAALHDPAPPPARIAVAEIGGRGGPDPTRYGDWEKNGRCIDF